MTVDLDTDERRTVHHRPARPTEKRAALDAACGRRRHRTRQREV